MDREERQKHIEAIRENTEALKAAGKTQGTNNNGCQILLAEIDDLRAALTAAREERDNALNRLSTIHNALEKAERKLDSLKVENDRLGETRVQWKAHTRLARQTVIDVLRANAADLPHFRAVFEDAVAALIAEPKTGGK